MNDPRALNKRYEAIAWGAFFIVFGLTGLFNALPNGVGTLAVGVILLGLNLARYLSHIPPSGFTTFLGAMALLFGGADLARDLLNLKFDLPVFPLLLIAIGVVWLLRAAIQAERKA